MMEMFNHSLCQIVKFTAIVDNKLLMRRPVTYYDCSHLSFANGLRTLYEYIYTHAVLYRT